MDNPMNRLAMDLTKYETIAAALNDGRKIYEQVNPEPVPNFGEATLERTNVVEFSANGFMFFTVDETYSGQPFVKLNLMGIPSGTRMEIETVQALIEALEQAKRNHSLKYANRQAREAHEKELQEWQRLWEDVASEIRREWKKINKAKADKNEQT